MDTFLAPVEKPSGLGMKIAYAMSRRQFGKVLTPLKVFAARMPVAFGMFTGKIAKLDRKLTLPPEPAMLVRERSPASTCACSASTSGARSPFSSQWTRRSSMRWRSTAPAHDSARRSASCWTM